MTLQEAAQKGITKVRKQRWLCKTDHLELQLDGEHILPWGTLHTPKSDPAMQKVLTIGMNTADWEPYLEPAKEPSL